MNNFYLALTYFLVVILGLVASWASIKILIKNRFLSPLCVVGLMYSGTYMLGYGLLPFVDIYRYNSEVVIMLGVGLILSLLCYLLFIYFHSRFLKSSDSLLIDRHSKTHFEFITSILSGMTCIISVIYLSYNYENLYNLKDAYFSNFSNLYYYFRVNYIRGGNTTPQIVQWGIWWVVNSVGLYIYFELLVKLKFYKKFDFRLVPVGFCCFLAGLLTMQKAPVLLFVVGTFFVLFYPTRASSKWNFKKVFYIFILALLAVGLAAFLYYLTGQKENPFYAVWERLVFTPLQTSYAHYYVFPQHHDFLHYFGSRSMNLLFGFGQKASLLTSEVSAAKIVAYYYYETIFNANASIVADGYANNGFWGVIQASIIVFGLLFFIDYLISSKRSADSYLPIVAFSIANISLITNGGLLTILYTFIPASVYIIITRFNRKRFRI